jgi:hypothetical protein
MRPVKRASGRGRRPASRRSRTARRLDRGRVFAAALALASAAALGTVSLWPQALPVAQVSVDGARHVAADAAIAASGVAGSPIFRASSADARARLRALPAVRDATVELRLPAGARITLSERVAAGRWVVGGSEWFIDADGVLFPSVDPTGAPDLRVVDERATPSGAGSRVDPALVAAALRLASLAPGELRPDALRPTVRIDKGPSGLVLQSGARWEIRFGGPDRLDEKLAAVRVYLKTNPTRTLDYVDVARPEFIVVRPE